MSVTTKLIVGVGAGAQTVTAEDLISISTSMSSSIDGGEIAVDTLSAIVLDTESGPNWAQLPHGTQVDYKEGTDLIGRFYVTGVIRVAKKQFQLKCVSALGLLDEINHTGGIYGGATVAQVLSEIIGSAFPYTVDPDVAGYMVGGWLPYDTARANLHRLLLALGINMLRGADGSISFGLLDSVSAVTVDDDDVYMGGEVGQGQPATSAAVTEHQYLQLPAERETLYDSSDGSAGDAAVLAVFDGPYYDLQASGSLTVLASGDNFARVQGVGILTGIPYTHTERIVRLEAETDSQAAREISVADDGLINPYNSARVAKRLLDYHSSARTIQGRLRLQPGSGIRPGKCLALTDAFGEPARAMLARMDITASATVAASIRAVVGYQGGQSGNTYTDRMLLTQSGTISAPTGHLRIIMIGGGQGGQGGYRGENGAGGREDPVYGSVSHPMYHIESSVEARIVECYREDLTTGGAGGEAGAGGTSGNVLTLDVDVLPGEELTFIIGSGGAGGAVNGGIGQLGTPTTVSSETIGSKSTADGAPSNLGVWDPLGTGDTYAAPGKPGTRGGDGGASTITQPRGWDGGNGAPGTGVGSNAGGAGGNGDTKANTEQGSEAGASGGGGGGAALGGNGAAGTSGVCLGGAGSLNYTATGGNGGAGANAQTAGSANYGCGGQGGNGGGGGGNAGGCYVYGSSSLAGSTLIPGAPGAGGSGSAGGTGGGGCVIILWDRYGRNYIPTTTEAQRVTTGSTATANTSGAGQTSGNSNSHLKDSVEASVRVTETPQIRMEITFGASAKANQGPGNAVMAHPLGVSVVDRVDGLGALAQSPEPEAVAASHVATAQTNRATGSDIQSVRGGAPQQARAAPGIGYGRSAEAGTFAAHPAETVEPGIASGEDSAVASPGDFVETVAVSIWGRWAWLEGDVLYIDQYFDAAAQVGATITID